jgi:hypothetical protein
MCVNIYRAYMKGMETRRRNIDNMCLASKQQFFLVYLIFITFFTCPPFTSSYTSKGDGYLSKILLGGLKNFMSMTRHEEFYLPLCICLSVFLVWFYIFFGISSFLKTSRSNSSVLTSLLPNFTFI